MPSSDNCVKLKRFDLNDNREIIMVDKKVAVVDKKDSYMQILSSFYYQKEYYNFVTFILGYYNEDTGSFQIKMFLEVFLLKIINQ